MAYLEHREYLAAVPPVAKSFEVYINQDDVEIIGNGIFITVPKEQLDSVERFLQVAYNMLLTTMTAYALSKPFRGRKLVLSLYFYHVLQRRSYSPVYPYKKCRLDRQHLGHDYPDRDLVYLHAYHQAQFRGASQGTGEIRHAGRGQRPDYILAHYTFPLPSHDFSEPIKIAVNVPDFDKVGKDARYDYIEKKFNMDFDFISCGQDVRERVHVWVAGDDMPEVMWVNLKINERSELVSWVDAGVIREFPDLSQYPNLKANQGKGECGKYPDGRRKRLSMDLLSRP